MLSSLWSGFLREIHYLRNHKWDLCLVTVAPLFIIILFSAMFHEGKAEHLPIAIIDQDQSTLSRNIEKYLSANHTLKVTQVSSDLQSAELQLNKTKIWGYVLIPSGAEQRLVQAKDAEIALFYNQSFFTAGNSISSAMLLSTAEAMADYLQHHHFQNKIPHIDFPTASIKISPLYNPGLNYEFYLQPFMIPAVLHLLLCCCVAFAVGQELKFGTLSSWTFAQKNWSAVLSKCMTYVLIFTAWTWLWMYWMIEIRGWFVAGSLWMILLAQLLFYSAYAFLGAAVVLATADLAKSFGFIAVYGGSSLSFAGVTLPLNNAPIFTQIWANIIPYTPYAKLQTEQWVVGSPESISLIPLFILIIYCMIYFALSCVMLNKQLKGVQS